MFDIDAILAKSDLLGYVERAGGKLTGNGKRYASHCPLHGGDNPTALSIYYKDGRWLWNCFTGSCGGGDAIRFIEVWQGLKFRDACEWINGGAIEDAEGMRESAERRLEQARKDAEEAAQREEARRKELQIANLHVLYHQTMQEYHRAKWREAGIDDGMQDFWTLGGKDDFTYYIGEQEYHTPTLTIPKFDENEQLLTIEHRLLNPHDPKDKYRPERKGLHAHPFLAVPSLGYGGETILVMEGAKKAMVTWTKVDGWYQCIGVPSQEGYKALTDRLRPVGSKVIVIPDPNTNRNPNALRKGWALAKEIGGSFMQVSMQIDDLILATGMSNNTFYRMLKQARRAV